MLMKIKHNRFFQITKIKNLKKMEHSSGFCDLYDNAVYLKTIISVLSAV